MGANPMQKMKRNAILIGLIVGLVIGLIMCGGLYLFLTQNSGTTIGGDTVTVCVLNKSIKSGTKITAADVTTTKVSISAAPADATTQVIDGIAKIDLSVGTVIGASMLNTSNETLTADLREQEYNMITLPTQLTTGEYIDIRLQLPNGGDYIVVSKKKVLKCNASTVWLNMYEEEIELMSNAIMEYYIMAGSKLYATKYLEPGIQEAAIGTYVPNNTVSDLIKSNPNIANLINANRYSEALTNIRNSHIKSELNQYSETRIENIEKNIQEEIKSLKESRESYFGILNAAN